MIQSTEASVQEGKLVARAVQERIGSLADDEIAQAQRQDIELGQLMELKEKRLFLPENSPLQKYAVV